MLLIASPAYSYVTIPTFSYSGATKGQKINLEIGRGITGYIDHSVWACSNPNIGFISKSDTNAQIEVINEFSGTAVVELLYVEKYVDNKGFTRSVTYYREFKITCRLSNSSNLSYISFPQTELKIGDIIEIAPKLIPSNAYVTYISVENSNPNIATFFLFNNTVRVRAINSGIATAKIQTSSGKSATATVIVKLPQTGSAIQDNNGVSIYERSLRTAVSNIELINSINLHHKH